MTLLFADSSGQPIRRDIDLECREFARNVLMRYGQWLTERDSDMLAEDIQDLIELRIDQIRERNAILAFRQPE